MSRFARASHVIWHCQYHVVWVPKYRFRMLQGPVGQEAYKCVMTFCQQLGCEVVELNVQIDHIHLLVKVPPRQSIADLMGVLKGRTAIRLFNAFPFFAQEALLGESFLGSWLLRGYGRVEQRDDSEVREISRKGRTASGTTAA